MKNIIYLILCVSFTFLNSQVEEGNTVRLQFIKVEEDNSNQNNKKESTESKDTSKKESEKETLEKNK